MLTKHVFVYGFLKCTTVNVLKHVFVFKKIENKMKTKQKQKQKPKNKKTETMSNVLLVYLFASCLFCLLGNTLPPLSLEL